MDDGVVFNAITETHDEMSGDLPFDRKRSLKSTNDIHIKQQLREFKLRSKFVYYTSNKPKVTLHIFV